MSCQRSRGGCHVEKHFKNRNIDSFIGADMKTVFVTVGTTSFDELIESITTSEAVQVREDGVKVS